MLTNSLFILVILLAHEFFTSCSKRDSSITINSSRSRTKNAQSCALFTQNNRDIKAKSFRQRLIRRGRVSSHHGHHNHNRRLLKPGTQDSTGRSIIVVHHFNRKNHEFGQAECNKRHIALEIYAKRLNMTLQNGTDIDDGSSKLVGTPNKARVRIFSKTTHNVQVGTKVTTAPSRFTKASYIKEREAVKATETPLKTTVALVHKEARKIVTKFKESTLPAGVTFPVTKPTATTVRYTSKTLYGGVTSKQATPHTFLTKIFVIPIQEEEHSLVSDTLKTVNTALNKAAKRSEPQSKKYTNHERKKRKKFIHRSAGKRKSIKDRYLNKHKMKRKKVKHYIAMKKHYKKRGKRKRLKGKWDIKKLRARKTGRNKDLYKHRRKNSRSNKTKSES